MSLSPEFTDFYIKWMQKAAQYSNNDIRHTFDKFFTLFVIYNRLYAEATFQLAQTPGSGIDSQNWESFPDGIAAKKYVANYLGARALIDGLNGDPTCVAAIDTLKKLLRNQQFFIKLNLVTGDRQPASDDALLALLEDRSCAKRADAILDIIYSIRCNMFHGHKGFNEVQLELIRPVIIILERICLLLWNKLSQLMK